MKTPLQAFRNFIENDRMQSTYTTEQILSLIDLLLLDREKEHILLAYENGSDAGYELAKVDDFKEDSKMQSALDYYNETYKNTKASD